MKNKVCALGLAVVLALAATGCKQAGSEPAGGSTPASVSESTAPVAEPAGDVAETAKPTAENQTVTLEGYLQYQDIEGGMWQLRTKDDVVVLRNAPGCHAIPEGRMGEQQRRVQVTGRYASAEGQMGIHMAGPYFEVERLAIPVGD